MKYFILFLSILIVTGKSIGNTEKESISPLALEYANKIESDARYIVLCENVEDKINRLRKIEQEFELYELSVYREMKDSCEEIWYYGNPALASEKVILSIEESIKDIDVQKQCKRTWRRFFHVWSSYKLNVANAMLKLRTDCK